MSQFTDVKIGPVLYRYTTGKEAVPLAWVVDLATMLESKGLLAESDTSGVLAGLEVLHRVEASLTERVKLKQRQKELGL